jgi:hypothetical protein
VPKADYRIEYGASTVAAKGTIGRDCTAGSLRCQPDATVAGQGDDLGMTPRRLVRTTSARSALMAICLSGSTSKVSAQVASSPV